MPANLPPDYFAEERKLKEASNPQEKVEIIRRMLAIMPKHKGTEHLQGQLKRKISKYLGEAQKKKGGAKSSAHDHFPKEGAGQVVLAGAPNTGKSALFNRLTHARSPTADYPFATFKPVQGMANFEDIQFQLIDLPPVSAQYVDQAVYNIIRLADLVLLVCDCADPQCIGHTEQAVSLLKEHNIILSREGVSNPVSAQAVKSALVFGNKTDLHGAKDTAALLQEYYNGNMPVVSASAETGEGMPALLHSVFECLRIIRVYTKMPGHEPDMAAPFILQHGQTVHDLAEQIHKDIEHGMKYARIWGTNTYDGQRVDKEHVLFDGDVVEIHTR